MVQRPPIRKLMEKVRRYRIEDSKTYSGVVGYTDVAMMTTRGRFTLRVEHAPGSPEWPMSDVELDEKFIDCAHETAKDNIRRSAHPRCAQ